MTETSHARYRSRYFNPRKAARYAGKQNDTKTHRRELVAIGKALDVPGIRTVLDLPCGAGRMVPELVRQGYCVTAADVAPPMVEVAREYLNQQRVADVDLAVADVLDTGFGDAQFDAVLCNRLFHHFSEADIRVAAFRELGRIAARIVVVSFFCNYAVDGLTFHLANLLRGRKSTDRIPIGLGEIKRDAREAGLTVSGIYPMRAPISRQWYLRLERAWD